MLKGLLVLVLCQVLGDTLVSVLGIPVPGAVVGMLLLFFGLCLRHTLVEVVEGASTGLLKYIGLIFVPAGVGIGLYLDLIVRDWKVILVASLVSTILTLALTAAVYTALSRRRGGSIE